MISIEYVNGFINAINCNQYGMNLNGAKAVLENKAGKFMINVNPKNSICPGTIKLRPILKVAILIIRIVVIFMIKKIILNFIVLSSKLILNVIMIMICIILTIKVYIIKELNKEFLFINGEIKILLRNPNSLSNIIGRPALSDELKAVKAIMP